MASAAPPVRYPNVYGIDMPSPKEFVADNRSDEEICKEIGADWLIYQDLKDLIKSVNKGSKHFNGFDCSCFDGQYITNDVDNYYLEHLEQLRCDASKAEREQYEQLSGIDLYSSQ